MYVFNGKKPFNLPPAMYEEYSNAREAICPQPRWSILPLLLFFPSVEHGQINHIRIQSFSTVVSQKKNTTKQNKKRLFFNYYWISSAFCTCVGVVVVVVVSIFGSTVSMMMMTHTESLAHWTMHHHVVCLPTPPLNPNSSSRNDPIISFRGFNGPSSPRHTRLHHYSVQYTEYGGWLLLLVFK